MTLRLNLLVLKHVDVFKCVIANNKRYLTILRIYYILDAKLSLDRGSALNVISEYDVIIRRSETVLPSYSLITRIYGI